MRALAGAPWLGMFVMLWSCSSGEGSAASDAGMSVDGDASAQTSTTRNASSEQAGRGGGGASRSEVEGTDEDAGTSRVRQSSGDDAGSGSESQASEASEMSRSMSTSTAAELQADGNQLALCAMAQGECNKGFTCRAPASPRSPGRGFCSPLCESDEDCDGLGSGAQGVCSANGGVRTCDLVCNGEDDSESCPDQMRCVQTAAARGGRGVGDAGASMTAAEFRCRYPFEASESWQPCDDGQHACAEGLACHSGYCVQACESDADCQDKPSSGSIAPTCATVSAARGGAAGGQLCVLDCSAADDGCPAGMSCVARTIRGRGNNNGGGSMTARCQ